MDQTEDAFGIYAAERSPTYKFVSIGGEGYRDKGVFNFLQDHYYVKLSGSGANVDGLLDQFARLLSERIGGVRTLPALLVKLPREHRVPHSEQYVRKDPLGHAFLHRPTSCVRAGEAGEQARGFGGQQPAGSQITSGTN